MDNLCTKWRQCQLGNLEELFSEWNPDHRTAPEESNDQIIDRHPQSTADQPDHIGQRGNGSSAVEDFPSEGVERQAGKFETLPSKRNADYRHTAEQAGNQPEQPTDKSPENKP